jgi:hypothetical protein
MDRDDIIAVFVLFGIPFIALMAICMLMDRGQCHARWDGRISHVEWGIMEGCMLKTDAGVWIPDEAYVANVVKVQP